MIKAKWQFTTITLFISSITLIASAGVEKRYIVQSKNLQVLESELTKKGLHTIKKMQYHQAIVIKGDRSQIEKLKTNISDLQIVEDIEMQASTDLVRRKGKPGGGGTVQPPQQLPWGIQRISAPFAHGTTKGAGVVVCVVDTGISKSHPDLQSNIIGGRNFVASRGKTNSSNWDDDNGHGSHVAGIIAAVDNTIGVIGVAPESSLYAVKVLNRQGSGYLSDVADGIMECVNRGAQVINMSLGATADPSLISPLKTAVETAISQGIQVVVAAGNEGQNIANTVPAGFPGTVAVAATDSTDSFPSWSNFGLQTDDYAAPGVGIYSTWMGSSYNTISGTSMASPHVAGAIALVIAGGKPGLIADDLGVSLSIQGLGLINMQSTFSVFTAQ